MKILSIVTAVLLVVGGLNWGLVGLFDFDLVARILGEMSIPSRIVYALVGASAVFQAARFRASCAWWASMPHGPVAAAH